MSAALTSSTFVGAKVSVAKTTTVSKRAAFSVQANSSGPKRVRIPSRDFSLFFSNETDQTSTRKRRIFRHAILRLDARAVHGASRSDGAVRRHAQSRITVRPVVPFALSGLDSRENAFGAVSCGRRRKRGSGENRWEYRNRRTIILKPPSVCSSRPLYIFCGPLQSSSQRLHARK